MATKLLVLSITVLLLVACGPYKDRTLNPIVDLKDVDRNIYAQDLQECQSYAGEIESSTFQDAAIGGLIGGLIDSIDGDSPIEGIAGGALLGGAGGASEDSMSRGHIVRKCLLGRGYKILY